MISIADARIEDEFFNKLRGPSARVARVEYFIDWHVPDSNFFQALSMRFFFILANYNVIRIVGSSKSNSYPTFVITVMAMIKIINVYLMTLKLRIVNRSKINTNVLSVFSTVNTVGETCHLRWYNDTDVLKIEFHASSSLSSTAPSQWNLHTKEPRLHAHSCDRIAAWFLVARIRINEEECLMIVDRAIRGIDITGDGSCPKRIESRNWRFVRISTAPTGRIRNFILIL